MLTLDIPYKLLNSGKMKHAREIVALRHQVLLTVGRLLWYVEKKNQNHHKHWTQS